MHGDMRTPSGETLARPIPGRRYYGAAKLTNWPGTLNLPINTIKVGRHNIARRRYDFWFTFESANWHGVQYGDNTQLAHCRKVKQ